MADGASASGLAGSLPDSGQRGGGIAAGGAPRCRPSGPKNRCCHLPPRAADGGTGARVCRKNLVYLKTNCGLTRAAVIRIPFADPQVVHTRVRVAERAIRADEVTVRI